MALSGTENLTSMLHRILQRRWFVIVPVVATMSLVTAYTRNVDLYRSSAIVLFNTEYVLADEDVNLARMFDQKVTSVVSSLRFGEPMRAIAQKVWPDVDPQQDPVGFNSRAQGLGSGRGLELIARRDNPRALTIAYTSKDPNEAHRVVQATIETLIDETRLHTERRVASSTSFVTREIESKRKELEKIDQEINRLETGYGVRSDYEVSSSSSGYPELKVNPATLGEIPSTEGLKFREGLPQLRFELTVAEKELQRLVHRLESKEFLSEVVELQGTMALGDDTELKQLRESIVAKERERNALSAQGILAKHPKRRSIEAELKNLAALEADRIRELRSSASAESSEFARLQVERKLRAQISEKTDVIAQLKDKIAVLEQYEKEIQSQQDSIVSQLDIISVQKSKLESLKRQKLVATEAYQQAVTELEIIRRHGRADEGDIGMRITVADEPSVPTAPVPYAHASTVVMSFFLSFAAGVCLICIVDAVDNSLKSPAELRELVSVPVVGEIDRMVSVDTRGYQLATQLVVIGFLLFIVLFSSPIVERLFL